MPLIARCAADGVAADLAGIYLIPELTGAKQEWRLGGSCGADPEVLREIERWWSEAERYGVLPLDDRLVELFFIPRPESVRDPRRWVYRPPMSRTRFWRDVTAYV